MVRQACPERSRRAHHERHLTHQFSSFVGLMATLLVAGVIFIFPFTPLGEVFGFSPLPIWFLAVIGIIVVLYIAAAEVAKRFFYSRVKF